MQTQEAAQKAKEAVTSVATSESDSLHERSKRKLPVGALVSSVNVDYEYFEVGTGQVRLLIKTSYLRIVVYTKTKQKK